MRGQEPSAGGPGQDGGSDGGAGEGMTIATRNGRVTLELTEEESVRLAFGKEVEMRSKDSGGPFRIVVRMTRPRRRRKVAGPTRD